MLLEVLGDLQEAPRLIERFLRRGVLALCNHKRVEGFGHRYGHPAACDFDLGAGDGLRSLGSIYAGEQEAAGRKVLLHDPPVAIDVNTVIGDEPAVGRHSVALGIQVLAGGRKLGQQRIAGLQAILGGAFSVGRSAKQRGIELLGALERVLDRQGERRGRLPRTGWLDQLHRWLGRHCICRRGGSRSRRALSVRPGRRKTPCKNKCGADDCNAKRRGTTSSSPHHPIPHR